MNGLRHPFTGALYEQDGNGNILVTHGERQGLFGADGHWISGELRQADPQLCNWVAGPMFSNHRLSARERHQAGSDLTPTAVGPRDPPVRGVSSSARRAGVG